MLKLDLEKTRDQAETLLAENDKLQRQSRSTSQKCAELERRFCPSPNADMPDYFAASGGGNISLHDQLEEANRTVGWNFRPETELFIVIDW